MKKLNFKLQHVVNIFTWLWKALPIIFQIIFWLIAVFMFAFFIHLTNVRTTDGGIALGIIMSVILTVFVLRFFYKTNNDKWEFFGKFLIPLFFVGIFVGLSFHHGLRYNGMHIVLQNETTGEWKDLGKMYNAPFERDVIIEHSLTQTIKDTTDFFVDRVELFFVFGTETFKEKMVDPQRDIILQKQIKEVLFTVSLEAMPSAQKQEQVKSALENAINDGDEKWCEVTYWRRKMSGYVTQ